MTICSRNGCDKKLRKDNAKGMCSSSCLSPDAPPAVRAMDVGERVPAPGISRAKLEVMADEKTGATMIRFRLVAEAVGRDADRMLEEYAQAWLDGLRQKLEG